MYEQEDLPVALPDDVEHACLRIPAPEGLPYGKRAEGFEPERQEAPDHGGLGPAWKRASRAMGRRMPGLRQVVRYIKPTIRHNLGMNPENFPFQLVIDEYCSMWRGSLALARVLDDLEPDAILAPQMEEASILTWMTQGVKPRPYVMNVQTIESRHIAGFIPDPERRRAFEWLFRGALSAAAGVTVVSPGLADDLREHYHVRGDHVRTVFNPVDPRVVRKAASAATPEDFPDESDGPVIVRVARVVEDKRPGFVLDAVERLKRRGHRFKLLFIGSGEGEAGLRRDVERRGLDSHVSVLGHRDNPHAYTSRARMKVVSSSYEGLPLAIIEAMACGCPVVSVDCDGGGARAALDGGRYGLLTSRDDVAAFAGAIERMLADDDLHAKMCGLLDEAVDRFDVARVMRQYELALSESVAAVGSGAGARDEAQPMAEPKPDRKPEPKPEPPARRNGSAASAGPGKRAMPAVHGVSVSEASRRAHERGEPVFVAVDRHSDERGSSLYNLLIGVMGPEGQVNVTEQEPGVVRAWHRHELQTDYWVPLRGSATLGVHDEDRGLTWTLEASDERPGVVIIPPRLWHGFATGPDQTLQMLYYASRAYDPERPDEQRRPADSVPALDWGLVAH